MLRYLRAETSEDKPPLDRHGYRHSGYPTPALGIWGCQYYIKLSRFQFRPPSWVEEVLLAQKPCNSFYSLLAISQTLLTKSGGSGKTSGGNARAAGWTSQVLAGGAPEHQRRVSTTGGRLVHQNLIVECDMGH